MQYLIDSVESALRTENWYAALTLALTLPDIAGKIDYPTFGSNKRYAAWFEKYCGDRYKVEVGQETVEHFFFLNGNDCYALRCSFLHEGKSEILHQRARNVLEDFEFIVPPRGGLIHNNRKEDTLQLQVDIFCRDILDGIRQWLADINNDTQKQSELNTFLRIFRINE